MQAIKTTMLDFNNTKYVFPNKSNRDLNRLYQMFKILNNKNLVDLGEKLLNIAFAIHFPINEFIRKTIYKHFVGGTSITDCQETIQQLANCNVGSILDYALEGEEVEEIFDATCNEIICTIEYAHDNKDVPFSAFKISGIGSLNILTKKSENMPLTVQEETKFISIEKRVEAIFRRGFELNIPVLIDAEHTWIQSILDKMVLTQMEKFNKEKAIVQNTYQLYRTDGLQRLKQHHQLALKKGFKFGLKIVRGAYMEVERKRANELGYPSPIQLDKAATDRDLDAAINYMFENRNTMDFMVATHNEKSTMLLANLINNNELKRNYPGIYFSQLYGMSDHITYNLAQGGYNVAKYLPYGQIKATIPYLLRRARENSSMKGQTSRELKLIKEEINRRRINK